MKRKLIVLLALLAIASVGDAQHRRQRPRAHPQPAAGTVNVPCPSSITKIEDCTDIGCSDEREFDPNLNKQKNTRTSTQAAEDWDFQDLIDLPDPVDGFNEGDTREKLADLKEGRMIRIIAFAVDVRRGSKESCNCGLSRVRDTDNHIVLIDPDDASPSLADEPDSVTAEFAPRVRLDHPNLSRAKLRPLILAARRQALLVRVKGLLMFDSYHSFHNALTRHNNWEIHPVFGLEYCPKRKTCTKDSNANWKDIEEQ